MLLHFVILLQIIDQADIDYLELLARRTQVREGEGEGGRKRKKEREMRGEGGRKSKREASANIKFLCH